MNPLLRMIYLVGQPGAGKSTLMRELTGPLIRVPCDLPVAHDRLAILSTGAVIAAEIGKQRINFGGTDALASAIIDKAAPWLETKPYPVLLGEGARLGNLRFIDAAVRAGYAVTLGLVDHDQAESWRLARSRELGRFQSESWVRGRRTSSVNLADNVEARFNSSQVRVVRGHPDDLLPLLYPALFGSAAPVPR